MNSLYQCCICTRHNSQIDQWQHWIKDPCFALAVIEETSSSTWRQIDTICYMEWNENHSRIRHYWFYICHQCLRRLTYYEHPTYSTPSSSSDIGRWSGFRWPWNQQARSKTTWVVQMLSLRPVTICRRRMAYLDLQSILYQCMALVWKWLWRTWTTHPGNSHRARCILSRWEQSLGLHLQIMRSNLETRKTSWWFASAGCICYGRRNVSAFSR